ncbi:hypothetical protein Tco_1026232 [Tanacetum coccineum]
MLAIQAEEGEAYTQWDGRVERATTTAASLDVEQASGNINRTQSTTIPNVPLPQGICTGGSPRCQEAIGGSIAQTRSERVPTPPCDSPLLRVHTLGSDEGSMPLQELTILCTTLSKKVESLEADLKQTMQVYGAAYTKLIMKVKRLEKTVKTSHSRRRAKIVISEDEEDYSKQGRMIEEIDQDAGVTLVTPTQGEDQPEDQLGVLSAAKVLADAAKTNVYTYTRRRVVNTCRGGISTAKESVSTADASMPVSTAGIVQEVNISIPSTVVVKDKGKEWENIRARVKADEELSRRLQAEERNKYSEVDQAKMLVDLINQRKKYFAAQKAKAKRNKPMTQAQQRNYMINYVKHISWKFKRAAEAELDHEDSKRQKTNEASGSVQEQPKEEEKELDDLVMLWNLVKERFSSTEPTDDKERTLWVELKSLFEPNTNDTLWKL